MNSETKNERIKCLDKHESENSLMERAWDHIGYEELVKHCKCLIEELKSLEESGLVQLMSGLNS